MSDIEIQTIIGFVFGMATVLVGAIVHLWRLGRELVGPT